MEIITVRFQEDILKRMDKSIKENNYNSRTEFVREAVREKLANLSTDELIAEFMKYRGKAKKKTTDEERMRIKEEVGRELLEEWRQGKFK